MLGGMPRGGDAARPSLRVADNLEPRPRQALGILEPDATVRHLHRTPLRRRLAPAYSEQRQRIKDALAHPQWSSTCLQRGGVEIPLHARKMIVPLRLGYLLCSADRTAIEVHQAPVRYGVGKDHTAAAPVAGWVWPGT